MTGGGGALQEELNPIEVSIEEIDKRVQALVCELEQKPPNIKTLQHVLQGSALPRTALHTRSRGGHN